MDKKITVHIADDHQILIDGVKAVLNIEPNIEVTGFSLNGQEVVDWFRENHADVLVLDINMPELDGLEVLKALRKNDKQPEIIVLSSYDDVKLVKEVLQMGAKGFVPKKSAGEHIVRAVYKVAEGSQYFTEDIKEKMMQTLLNGQVKNEGQPGRGADQFTDQTGSADTQARGAAVQYQGDRGRTAHQRKYGRNPPKEPDAQGQGEEQRGTCDFCIKK